jgi:hypothetical protein
MKLSKSRGRRRRKSKSPDGGGIRNVYKRSSKSFENNVVKMKLDNINDVVDFEYINKRTGYILTMHMQNNNTKPVIRYDNSPTTDDINNIKNFIPKSLIPSNLFLEDE